MGSIDTLLLYKTSHYPDLEKTSEPLPVNNVLSVSCNVIAVNDIAVL